MIDSQFLKTLKGTTEFLPKQQLVRNYITDILRKTFESYGFLPAETPILNPMDLLASKYAGGAEILKEVYKLTDQGKREIGLRYDLTVPFSRMIADNQELGLPFRRYEIGKVFRDGPVKAGRNREFYQCDVDVCGINGVYVESEFFAMTISAFKQIGIEIELTWNNRKFLSGLITESGLVSTDDVSKVILVVDKLEKVGKEQVVKELNLIGLTNADCEKLFGDFELSLEQLNKKYKDTKNELLSTGLSEVLELQKVIDTLGLSECRFVPFLARGLDIYTGTVWEIFDTQKRITSSLGGGGRYDKIITNFIDNGREYPAVGMSFGLEPIYEIVKKFDDIAARNMYDIFVYGFDLNSDIIAIADKLRQGGLKVLVELSGVKLKKALDFANKQNIQYVALIGENELKDGVVTLKDMFNSTQETLTVEQVIGKLK